MDSAERATVNLREAYESMERPTRHDIAAAIRRTLQEELRVSEEAVAGMTGTTPLLGLGIGLDSIEALTLAMSLEHAFSIRIPDGDLTTASFRTLDSLIDYIDSRVSLAA
jgi:acyl carrier protein